MEWPLLAADLDTDGDGIISSEEMVAMLRNKLPKAEVEAAVRHALQEAARRSEGSLHRRTAGEAGDSVHSNGSAGDSVRDGMSFRQVGGCWGRATEGLQYIIMG